MVEILQRLPRLPHQAAARIAGRQRLEQTLRRAAIGVLAEAVGGEHRQVGGLPERVVAVAAGRIAADDLLVGPDERVGCRLPVASLDWSRMVRSWSSARV